MEKARKSQQTKWLVVLLITAMIVALCTPAEQSEAAKKPRLSKKTVVLTVGKSKKVKVKYVNKKTKITWKSKNKKIATVSKTGKITAKEKGKTYVTSRFRYRGKKYVLKCRVTVKKQQVFRRKNRMRRKRKHQIQCLAWHQARSRVQFRACSRVHSQV